MVLSLRGEKPHQIVVNEKISPIVLVSQTDQDIPGRSHGEKNEDPPAYFHLPQEVQSLFQNKKKTDDQAGQHDTHRSLGQDGKTQGGITREEIPLPMSLIRNPM